MDSLYKNEPSSSPKSGMDNIGTMQALKLFGNTNILHNREESIRALIQRLFESEFTVTDPSGTRMISSKTMMQALLKVWNKFKPLDFSINGSGILSDAAKQAGVKEAEIEKIVTDGISTVMDHGNFTQCLRDKNGAFYQMAMYGDAFIHVGAGEKEYPIQFRVGSLSDVYMDQYCTQVRDPVGGLSANEMAVIYRYSWDTFSMLYPDAKDVGLGRIPRGLRMYKQLEKTWLQESTSKAREIEVCYYYNLGQKTFTVMAGSAMTVIEELSGEDYPFLIDGDAYLPVLHFKCFPTSEGFYNRGFGHLLFDLAVLTARLDNMAYKHGGRNVDPINIVNTPKSEVSAFFQKVAMAKQQIAAGGDGWVVNPYDAGGTNQTTVTNLQTPPITAEWERLFTRLEIQIKRLGIPLDGIDYGAQKTATQIMAEEDNADSLIKQIMEWNASESKFAVELTIDFIKQFIGKKNKTLVDSTTELAEGLSKITVGGFTLGNLSEQLKQGQWFVKINARTGSIPSNVMQQAQLERILSMTPPGTPAYAQSWAKLAKLNGQDFTADMLSMPAPQGQGGTPGDVSPEAMVSATDKVRPLAGRAAQPAIA